MARINPITVLTATILLSLCFMSPADANTTSYQYDALGRLVYASSTDAVTLTEISFSYDAIGNIQDRTVTKGAVATGANVMPGPDAGPDTELAADAKAHASEKSSSDSPARSVSWHDQLIMPVLLFLP